MTDRDLTSTKTFIGIFGLLGSSGSSSESPFHGRECGKPSRHPNQMTEPSKLITFFVEEQLSADDKASTSISKSELIQQTGGLNPQMDTVRAISRP